MVIGGRAADTPACTTQEGGWLVATDALGGEGEVGRQVDFDDVHRPLAVGNQVDAEEVVAVRTTEAIGGGWAVAAASMLTLVGAPRPPSVKAATAVATVGAAAAAAAGSRPCTLTMGAVGIR